MRKLDYHTLLIIITAFLVRIISINQSLWLDEATSANTAINFTYKEIMNNFITGDFHPPLYYILLKTWIHFFGNSELSMRYMSVVIGTLIVYFVILIATKIKNRKVGLLSGILAATSPLLIYYSHEIRMYSLATLLVAINIYCFIKTKDKSYWWIFYTLSSVFILYTDYPASTILVIYPIYSLLKRYDRKWWLKYIFSQMIILSVFLFWIPVLSIQLNSGLSVKNSNWWNKLGILSAKQLALIAVKFVIGRISFANKFIYAIVSSSLLLVYGILFLIGLIKSKLVALWIVIPPIALILLSIFIPVLQYFRLLFILPAILIIVAIALNAIPRKAKNALISLIVILNIVFTATYLFNPYYHREDWKGFVNLTKSESASNSAILFPADSQKEAVAYYKPSVPVLNDISENHKYKYLWYVKYVEDIVDPKLQTQKNIEKLGYKAIGEYNFNGVIVIRYENFN